MDAAVIRSVAIAIALTLVACGSSESGRFGRMPSDRHRPQPRAPLDGGVPFDFRWVRIEPASHVGAERSCDVTYVGGRESVSRRIERRYGTREVSERVSIRCRAGASESWVDLVFPPAASSFASAIAVGQRLTVDVVSEAGGFENATIAEFRAIVTGAENVAGPLPIVNSVPAAFDFDQLPAHPELVGRVEPCGVAWIGSIEPIPTEARDRYPRGATHRLKLSCSSTAGEAMVDIVTTPRAVVDLLRLERGIRVRLRVLAARGGTDDVPLVRLEP